MRTHLHQLAHRRCKPLVGRATRALITLALVTCGSTAFAQTLLFQDDFSDGTYKKWRTYYGDSPSAAVFSVTNGAFLLQCNTWCGDARAAVGIDTNWTDYSLDLDFKMISGGNLNTVGILFRVRSLGNGCDVGQYDKIVFGQNEMALTQIDNSEGHGTPELWTTVSLSMGEWYHFRLEVIGRSVTAFINQQRVLSFCGLDYPNGGIGVGTINEGNAVLFDNVVVSAITDPGVKTTRYVWQDSPIPGPPYASWATAAHVIQDAVDVAQTGDTVLVAGGVYATGGRAVYGTMTNRVAIDRCIRVESLMGPEVTIIQGYQVPGTTNGDGAIRCVYLTYGASLSGFTLTKGATLHSGDVWELGGGGLWCESQASIASNCVVVGNAAAGNGGGLLGGTLNDCTLTGNWAGLGGGGTFGGTLNHCTLTTNSAHGAHGSGIGGGAAGDWDNNCTLNNCTLTGNSANDFGGGAAGRDNNCTLNNCTLTGNSARSSGGGAYWCTLNNCTLTDNSARYGGGAAGGMLNNCTLSDNSATDYGGGAESSTLYKCTLSGNSATNYGGGADGGMLDNCTLTGNSAVYGGGGAWGATLNNCTLSGNSAVGDYAYGGGAGSSTLYNCTLTGNSAVYGGGGASWSTLNNCILYFNAAATNGVNYFYGTLSYCCTTPQPTNGFGNMTNAPLFVDYAGGNLRLQSNSPCINAGTNFYAVGSTDLDGRPRIVGGRVDIGAYEFQPGVSGLFIGWLQQFGLPTDGAADYLDSDGDGLNNWQEWRCLTDPTNALSALRLLTASPAGTNVTVSWHSKAGVNYLLERSTNLSATPPFTLLATGIPGQSGTTSFTDTNAAPLAPLFYRVGVGN
jgi:parallel beta-helix repeat protein